jgi:hypothetical protein
MPVPTASDTTLDYRAAEAIRAYLAQVATLATWQAAHPGRAVTVRRFGDPRDLVFPVVAVRVMGLKQAWPGSDEYTGRCAVCVMAQPETTSPEGGHADTAETHRAANEAAAQSLAALIGNALQQQGAIKAFLNAGFAGRPVTDFHFYGFTDLSPDTDLASDDLGRRWEIAFDRGIVCAECDYSG